MVSTRKPSRGILIYPSVNLTRPPHDYLADGDYDRWVSPTATDLPNSDTALSIISAQKKNLRAAVNTPAIAINDSDNNLHLNFH